MSRFRRLETLFRAFLCKSEEVHSICEPFQYIVTRMLQASTFRLITRALSTLLKKISDEPLQGIVN